MSTLSASEVIANAFYISEQDTDVWANDSDEYALAQGFANMAINRFENYDNTQWRELWSDYSEASGVTTTVTAGDYTYAGPTDMRYPASYVRTVDSSGNSQFWTVIPVEKVGLYANSKDKVCWFEGNEKNGFVLNFNPNTTLTTGDTIKYEYYKTATKYTAANSTTEIRDPYYISYFIAAHLGEDGVDVDFMDMAEARLEQMRTTNMSGTWGVPNPIDDTDTTGFGT